MNISAQLAFYCAWTNCLVKLPYNMTEIEKEVQEVLHNLNWLLESHGSQVELVKITGNKVTIRCIGFCNDCDTDCVGVAFKERMPDIELNRK